MRTIIIRRLEFDAGHRVLGHEGKCRHPHGHRYAVEIEVSAPELDSIGRVIDFSIVKELLGGWIDENLDHAFLVSVEDEPLAEALHSVGSNVYTMMNNPTAENIAALLLLKATDLLRDLMVESVTVYETPNCRAVAR